MFDKSELDKVAEQLRKERINQRNPNVKLNEKLAELKKKEPSLDSPFFRLAIIGYELGKTLASLEHAIVYAERFKTDPVMKRQELKNAQLELGDCFTQLQLLAITYGFDIDETRAIGAQHLAERHDDFKIKGWTEV